MARISLAIKTPFGEINVSGDTTQQAYKIKEIALREYT